MEGLITREDSVTSEKFGKRPEDRTLDELKNFGIVVVDKPSGPTSHQVSAYVQQILDIHKSGHSGTLDPKVTGVLPVGLGTATRLLEYLLVAGKTYVGVMRLHADATKEQIMATREKFLGTITQLPPKRSAVKRQNRKRAIYRFDILEIDGRDVLFEVDVQAGTYIRKLCHDFGEQIGTGAHMAELRRTRASIFVEEQSVTLQQLTDAYEIAKDGDESLFRTYVMSAEEIVKDLPAVVVLDSAVNSITHGATLKVPGIAKVSPGIDEGDLIQLLTLKGELIAVGTARMPTEGMLRSQGIAVKPEKVVMADTVYPRME